MIITHICIIIPSLQGLESYAVCFILLCFPITVYFKQLWFISLTFCTSPPTVASLVGGLRAAETTGEGERENDCMDTGWMNASTAIIWWAKKRSGMVGSLKVPRKKKKEVKTHWNCSILSFCVKLCIGSLHCLITASEWGSVKQFMWCSACYFHEFDSLWIPTAPLLACLNISVRNVLWFLALANKTNAVCF